MPDRRRPQFNTSVPPMPADPWGMNRAAAIFLDRLREGRQMGHDREMQQERLASQERQAKVHYGPEAREAYAANRQADTDAAVERERRLNPILQGRSDDAHLKMQEMQMLQMDIEMSLREHLNTIELGNLTFRDRAIAIHNMSQNIANQRAYMQEAFASTKAGVDAMQHRQFRDQREAILNKITDRRTAIGHTMNQAAARTAFGFNMALKDDRDLAAKRSEEMAARRDWQPGDPRIKPAYDDLYGKPFDVNERASELLNRTYMPPGTYEFMQAVLANDTDKAFEIVNDQELFGEYGRTSVREYFSDLADQISMVLDAKAPGMHVQSTTSQPAGQPASQPSKTAKTANTENTAPDTTVFDAELTEDDKRALMNLREQALKVQEAMDYFGPSTAEINERALATVWATAAKHAIDTTPEAFAEFASEQFELQHWLMKVTADSSTLNDEQFANKVTKLGDMLSLDAKNMSEAVRDELSWFAKAVPEVEEKLLNMGVQLSEKYNNPEFERAFSRAVDLANEVATGDPGSVEDFQRRWKEQRKTHQDREARIQAALAAQAEGTMGPSDEELGLLPDRGLKALAKDRRAQQKKRRFTRPAPPPGEPATPLEGLDEEGNVIDVSKYEENPREQYYQDRMNAAIKYRDAHARGVPHDADYEVEFPFGYDHIRDNGSYADLLGTIYSSMRENGNTHWGDGSQVNTTGQVGAGLRTKEEEARQARVTKIANTVTFKPPQPPPPTPQLTPDQEDERVKQGPYARGGNQMNSQGRDGQQPLHMRVQPQRPASV